MHQGGLERVVSMLAVGQKADSVHVAAVVEPGCAESHPFVIQLQQLGVQVTAVTIPRRRYLREYRNLSTLVGQLKPRVVHTHGYRADVIGGAAARARHVPVISTVHGFTGGVRNRVYEVLQLLALRRANAVIAVSTALVQALREAGIPPQRIWRLPNAFLPFGETLTRVKARRTLGIADETLVAGWVGRLSHEKGPDVMVAALAESAPAWHLSVIGDGNELDYLRDQAAKLGVANRVSWHGAIADAGSLMAAFDAFVLSSHTEGTPITLLEAMNAGTPIVATAVGGVPDVVDSSQAILVPPKDPAAIARALWQIQNDRLAAAERAKCARRRLNESFGSADWLRAVDAVYESATSEALVSRDSKTPLRSS